jgi:Carboxypeptidase regulatory-like domain
MSTNMDLSPLPHRLSRALAGLLRATQRFLFVAMLSMAAPAFGQEGSIAGAVVDASGASVAHARVTLTLDGSRADRETQSTETGDYRFTNVDSGEYRLTFAAEGFATKIVTGALRAGEAVTLLRTVLAVAAFSSEVNVTPAEGDIAEVQIKQAEKQRIVGLIPNYFVNYDRDAAPLNARQKFELSWKGFVDPTAFVATGVGAGIAQARNTNPGFGLGAQGYAKRYATTYAEFVTGRVIAKVVTPVVFRQDPRYFYQGTGTIRSRFIYATSRSVICRGDDKQPQLCYSSLAGRFAAAALTNLYLPPSDRNSTRVVFENAAIGIGGNAVGNLLQEFVIRKLTPKKQ